MKHDQYVQYFYNLLKKFMNLPDDKRPSISLFIDILKYLTSEYSEKTFNERFPPCVAYFLSYTNSASGGMSNTTSASGGLPDEYIYKSILGMQKDEIRKSHKSYIDYFYTQFFKVIKDPKYTILTGQYILNNIDQPLIIQEVEQRLLDIAQNEAMEYNIRADSADTLLKAGKGKLRYRCIEIINELGKSLDKVQTLYTNRQNAHDANIEESVKTFLLSLGGIKTGKITDSGNERFLKYDDIVQLLLDKCRNSINYSKGISQVQGSLVRIKIDQLIYPGSQTLSTIFLKIYELITSHEYKDLLLDRLIEELIDMDSTCSSGHCNRLVNVFSGIDGFSINIGFSKQIYANILARIQALIKEEKDEVYIGRLLDEMSIKETENRPAFNKFYNTHIMDIYNEMFKEFVPAYLSSDDFELYFREGISHFEIGK